MGLECESNARMSGLGSCFFIGFMIGAIVFLRLSDIVGRRPVVLVGYLLQIISSIILLSASNIETLYVGLFLLGLKSSPQVQVAYIQIQ